MSNKLKHLEFIQGVINRLSTNSFLLKGWSVILVSALFALSAANADAAFIYLAYIPAAAFWGLDGYFLALERRYRKHYNIVCALSEGQIDFSMNVKGIEGKDLHWTDAVLSKTILCFHIPLVMAIAVVMFIQT